MGYIGIDPGTLTIPQVCTLFQDASHIAGIHGAGLMNFVFSKKGAKIIEIQPSTGVWRSIRYVAQSLGMNHIEVVASKHGEEVNGQTIPSIHSMQGIYN